MSLHCPKIILDLGIKIEPVTAGVVVAFAYTHIVCLAQKPDISACSIRAGSIRNIFGTVWIGGSRFHLTPLTSHHSLLNVPPYM